MERLPRIESISTMKHSYREVLAQLSDGPVVLTQHGKAVAVLVSPNGWNRAADEREELLDEIALLKAELAIERGEDTLTEVNPDTFVAEMSDAPVQA